MSKFRTALQAESDKIDCDLCRIEVRLQDLADRIKVAGPKLRRASFKVGDARAEVRQFMHEEDLKAKPY